MSEILILSEKLKTEGEKTFNYFNSLSDEEWTTKIYTEGTVWTVRNVLSHLAASEQAFVKLFENIRQGGAGVSEDFKIDSYNARQQEKTKDMDPRELLSLYKSVREKMITWVSGIGELDLGKVGRHPFLGQTLIREMIKMVYIHNQIHYRDIRKALGQ